MENSKGNKYVWYALQLFIFTIVLYMSKMYLGIAMFTLTTIAILITMYKRDSGICDLYFDDDYPKQNIPYMPLRTFSNIININPKGKIIKKK